MLPFRNSVRVLLLNDQDELLLICADDPNTGSNKQRFWFTVGGEMHKGETVQETALREVYEEAGIAAAEIELGPVVWFGELDLVVSGILTHLKQTFIVGRTKQKRISLTCLDQGEKKVIQEVAWFSLQKIKTCKEPIYPIVLSRYLPDIIGGNYPKEPMEINL